MTIHILSSTDRPNSNARKVSDYVAGLFSAEIDAKVFSLEDYPFGQVNGGKYGHTPEDVSTFNGHFLDADGYLFVVPEYNGGFPGVLKQFIDYLPFPKALAFKPVSMIGEAAGSFGALRPVEHLQDLFIYRKALVYPERMFISGVNDAFAAGTGLQDEKMQSLLEQQVQGFEQFVERVAGFNPA
ncbi:MAG: NADPH-dependent FMN reductase [Balneolaceae bacterium]